MGSYTKPKLNKANCKMWFVWYNYRVPEHLKSNYKRGWLRFKVYQGINRVPIIERETAALELITELTLALRNGWLNPFEPVDEVIQEIVEAQKPVSRMDMLCADVFPLFMQSRTERKLDGSSIVSYRSTINWLTAGVGKLKCCELKYTDISDTISKTANEPGRKWGATTINKEWDFAQTVLNWMALEDYIIKNPAKGKVVKLPTDKTTNRWYDKDVALVVKRAIKESRTPWLLGVCQFTYEILIRSKQELRNIKIGDIDTGLRRVAFRKEWTKNSADQYRDYSEAFHQLVTEMGVDAINKDWYIFGKHGRPGPIMCSHNYFSKAWAKIRDKVELSDEYTIYGWKHTAIVHDMMRGVDGYTISHRARHSDTKTTDDYKRDYDITLNRVYDPADLLF